MKKYNLGNGHTLEVEKVNRGYGDEYLVLFKEDGRQLGPGEYYDKEALEYDWGITV